MTFLLLWGHCMTVVMVNIIVRILPSTLRRRNNVYVYVQRPEGLSLLHLSAYHSEIMWALKNLRLGLKEWIVEWQKLAFVWKLHSHHFS